jgi:hypothetical protein
MNLVNLQGTAIFGAGSEWFWSMLQFVVVAATLVGLYRQLRIQSSQRAVEQLDAYVRDWESERMTHHKLAILVALRDGVEPANIPDGPAIAITSFWEKVSALTRAGHLDVNVLWEAAGNDGQLWWMTLGPYAERSRLEIGDSKILEHFEWLSGRLAEMNRRAGTGGISEGWIEASLGRRVAMLEDELRLEQALRTVIIASPDTPSPELVPAPAAAAPRKGHSAPTPSAQV